jgi:periplasmic divalent cation tolerance protein
LKEEFLLVLVTTPTMEEGERIAHILLNAKKAACVNIVPAVLSRFWWQGKIDSADEALLMVKTRAPLLEELIRLVKENHSYEVPEVIALPISAGNEDYLRWLAEAT